MSPPDPSPPPPPLARRLLAELVGSALLAAVVVGSGIAAQRLSPGAPGLELLENAGATALGLFAVILMVGDVSGAHLNPVVSLADAVFGGLRWRDAGAYAAVQVAGCAGGAAVANLMYQLDAVTISTHDRSSGGHWLGEVVATAGLVLLVFALARSRRTQLAAPAVGAYIGAAYFFTSSTSFANPAITAGRMLSNSFAGISPASVPGFVVAQLIGGAVAIVLLRTLYPATGVAAADVVLPHGAPDVRGPAGSGTT